ncbi:type II secretion system F family protein [Vreelandella nanhaiensis]|uniref:Type II secretion system F family protein n=1 Tax=Vreelandella nanhaiensis TaxID=1258546 RepID=A0A3S0XWG7_9GAMM|nr:type II secretion system F family protein [Halomonas nanhaiensis]RUR31798.1 type II secretion system F family protein [Halomonas nanhaiensis]
MARQTNKSKVRPRHLYRWKWIGIGPQARSITGESIGHSKSDIIVELSKQNIHVRRIHRKGGTYSSGGIKPADIMIFSRQMATMVKAGIPLLQALNVVAESFNKPSMVALIKRLADEVASGTSFTDALGNHPQHFDQLFIHLVEAGEQAGTLSAMLDRNAIYKEKVESLKARVKKALWYPATVLITGWGITLLLLVKVVPQFEGMFQSFGAELPALTQLTVNLSALAQQLWLPLLGILMMTVLVFKRLARGSSAFAYRQDQALLRLPVIGSIVNKAAVARFARTLATTSASGVPLVDGLDTAAGSTGNKVYEQAVRQARQDVATGQQLHFSMRMTNCFPALTVQMISIGEEAGALVPMLHRIAEYYEEEVDNAVDALTSLMEPLIIIILGILVGGIVVSMYLPIFDLGTVI